MSHSNHSSITNTIQCLNLNFMGGQASSFINVPFVVNEVQIVGISYQLPQTVTTLLPPTVVSPITTTFNGTVRLGRLNVSVAPSFPIVLNMLVTGNGSIAL